MMSDDEVRAIMDRTKFWAPGQGDDVDSATDAEMTLGDYKLLTGDLLATRAANVALQAEVAALKEKNIEFAMEAVAADRDAEALRDGMPNASELVWLAGECDEVSEHARFRGNAEKAEHIAAIGAWLRKLAGGA